MHRFLSSTLFRSWSSRFCLPDSPIWLYLGLWNWTHVGVWSTPPSIHASHLSALCISTSSSQHPKPGATHTLLSFPCAGHQQSLAIYLLPKYIEILTSLNPFLTKSSPNHCLLSWLLKLGLTSQLGSSGHLCLPVEDCCLGKWSAAALLILQILQWPWSHPDPMLKALHGPLQLPGSCCPHPFSPSPHSAHSSGKAFLG